MKYFNEKNGKYYDTAEECESAEKELIAQENEKANTKKALASEIEVADKKVAVAYKKYNAIRSDAMKIIAEAEKKANDLLAGATSEIVEAEKERRAKLLEFNQKFGPYKKVYTTDIVDDEAMRAFYDLLNYRWFF